MRLKSVVFSPWFDTFLLRKNTSFDTLRYSGQAPLAFEGKPLIPSEIAKQFCIEGHRRNPYHFVKDVGNAEGEGPGHNDFEKLKKYCQDKIINHQ